MTSESSSRGVRSLTDIRLDEENKATEVELKAYSAWCNTFLAQRELRVSNLASDLADGVLLINLIEIAFGVSLGKYSLVPRQLPQKIANVAVAFSFLEQQGIELLSISPGEIVKQRVKFTIIVLWNIIRGLTMKGLNSSVSKSNAASVKKTLLDWCQTSVQSQFASAATPVQIGDFKESWKDGVNLCALVNTLVPGKIDVASLDKTAAVANVENAIHVAEEYLGIPGLIAAQDLAAGNVDEQTVMNYVCMLVSASKSKALAQEQEDQKRQVELSKLQETIDKEKEQSRVLLADVEQLRQTHLQQLESDRKLREQIDVAQSTLSAEKEAFEKKYEALIKAFEQTTEALRDSRENEKRLEAALHAKTLENTSLQSDMYKMHRENEDMLLQLRKMQTEVHTSVTAARAQLKDSGRKGSTMMTDISNRMVNESLATLMSHMDEMNGILLKKRPENKVFNSYKERYFVLKSDRLCYYDKKDSPDPKGVINLSFYRRIEWEDKSTSSEFTLVPNGVIKGEKIVHLKAPGGSEEATAWVRALNVRIALASYVFEINANSLRGCREIVDFVSDTDLSLSTLRIEEDTSSAVRNALVRLREVLISRPRFRNLVINLCELNDEDMKLIGAIVSGNKDLSNVELKDNHISARGAAYLAESLAKEHSLTKLVLDGNRIGDEGVVELAKMLSAHPRISHLSLNDNEIGDAGVASLCDTLITLARRPIEAKTPTSPRGSKQLQAPASPRGTSNPAAYAHYFPALYLSNNKITSKGVSKIAQLCQENPSIKEVCLEHNVIDDDGLIALCDAVKSGKTGIVLIKLGANQVSSKGVIALSEVLKTTSGSGRLEIDLCGNKMVGRSGLAAIMDADFPLEVPLFRIARPH